MRRWSIAARLFALQFVVILALTAGAVALIWADARADVERDAAERSLAVAETIAHDPFVEQGVAQADPSAVLQPYAVDIMAATGVDFVTIMSPDRVRYTHRDPAEIGKRFLGTIDRALAGQSFTETYTGTLGPSVRAVVPIRAVDSDASGPVTALVSVGITVSSTQIALGGRVTTVLVAAGLALLVGAAASWALSRYLRRVTGGRGPEEMGRMFAYYEGVLHSIGEGLVLQDTRRDVVLYNDRAAELLGIAPLGRGAAADAPAVPLAALRLPEEVAAVLARGDVAVDEILITATHVLVVDRDRVVSRGGFVGTVTTLRDHTRLQELTGELATMTTLSDALRSQAHEFANRLHTIIALIELDRAPEAAALAVSEHAVAQQLADRILTAVDEPVLLALLLGKSAQAAERGIALDIDIPTRIPEGGVPPQELITVVGNLLDNAMDAVAGTDSASVRVEVEPVPGARDGAGGGAGAEPVGGLLIAVSDSGAGPSSALGGDPFERGVTTKGVAGHGIGLALVRQAVARLGGTIEVEGSRFAVTVPFAARGAREPEPARQAAPEPARQAGPEPSPAPESVTR